MLGNYYLLVGDYYNALTEYEKNEKNRNSTTILKIKKLLCYLVLNNMEKALEQFKIVLNENLNNNEIEKFFSENFITELIYKYENDLNFKFNKNKNLILGIIWFFKDKKNSIEYLSKVKECRDILEFIVNNNNQIKN